MLALDLRALRDKYERILRLRILHDRAREEPSFEEPDPRVEMRALASRFPGSLREIDELALDVIRARIDALAAAERDQAKVAPWMRAQAAFHRLARGALAAKRWLSASGRSKKVTPAVRAAFLDAIEDLEHGDDARAWVDDLAAIAAPPRGRVLDLVHARVARELDVDRATARALLR
ncbi:MAG: hypothetical protein KF819_38665 [Labilithrix sp.]|nr:hypothetical protein [Labilithrix sp.]